jgi:predicted ester cyclase
MAQTQLERWYEEVWNNANEHAIDDLLDESAIIHGLETDSDKTGPQAFKPFYHGFRKNFPTVNIKLEPIITTSNYEAAQCIVNGRTVDGKEVNFTGLTIAKFKDGKLIEGWNAFDFLTMHKQLENTIAPNSNQPR